MAKASRSSKKQPDFDPSEIEDLIFSPAVGKGVGSHLVNPVRVTTIVTSDPVRGYSGHVKHATVTADKDLPTSRVSTVSTSEAPESDLALTTVVAPDMATVAMSKMKRPSRLWITENGDLVSEARVKKIRLAQDVINSAEESVYDTLWNAKLIGTDERDASRLVQAGYDYLVKRTRLSRKTIQRIVAKLLEKDFITVNTRADIYQRSATVYRVFSYKAVLERHTKKGRTYVAKMGPGFSYARPLDPSSDGSETLLDEVDMTTVAVSESAIVVNDNMATVVNPAIVASQTTVTVAKNDRPTVVKMSSHLLDTKVLGKGASSSYPAVRAALASYGQVDDDVPGQLMAACRSYAGECTEDEVVHFIHEKGSHVQRKESRVRNPLGFLLTAVPKCFSSDSLGEYRAQQGRERLPVEPSSDDPALLRWKQEQQLALSDPLVSEQEKHLIRLCLGLNTS